ncbi:uncharacterized protein MYCFIDRAFT_169307 [Pseudocercospora fijiensis CIRAD86]|uniref:Uncharacterized protein n=1 Tax=Pseudocercospora fijiensis (strain CIRAD86) TaxID=383855 RepID=N1Q9C2_PSEFD|nr:uncharacterized protein MYCFIDRAFT_169307 [Pseudocercospora fijiensis CIRAD86]EME87488.1 hypothetical protein MYCFIDRAFT_169307 [Pseudocercospora fijiensis CIRAD86]
MSNNVVPIHTGGQAATAQLPTGEATQLRSGCAFTRIIPVPFSFSVYRYVFDLSSYLELTTSHITLEVLPSASLVGPVTPLTILRLLEGALVTSDFEGPSSIGESDGASVLAAQYVACPYHGLASPPVDHVQLILHLASTYLFARISPVGGGDEDKAVFNLNKNVLSCFHPATKGKGQTCTITKRRRFEWGDMHARYGATTPRGTQNAPTLASLLLMCELHAHHSPEAVRAEVINSRT